nr:unnamed protein product [Digitaria exilis]
MCTSRPEAGAAPSRGYARDLLAAFIGTRGQPRNRTVSTRESNNRPTLLLDQDVAMCPSMVDDRISTGEHVDSHPDRSVTNA